MFTSRECSKCFGKTADELFQLAIESRRTLTSHELRTSPEGGKRSAPPLSSAEAGAFVPFITTRRDPWPEPRRAGYSTQPDQASVELRLVVS